MNQQLIAQSQKTKLSTEKTSYVKYKLNKIAVIFYLTYLILPFFRQPSIQVKQFYSTAIIFTIPYSIYAILEIAILSILLIIRYIYIKSNQEKIITIVNATLIMILITVIMQHYLFNQTLVDLVVRPIFLILYYESIYKLAELYLQIVKTNIKYYLLMWIVLLLFSASGYVLFSQYTFKDKQNIFLIFWDAIFQLLVLQSTANFPDVALPFYRQFKLNYLFFVLLLIANTMIASNIIIATSFNTFKKISQKEQVEFALPKILLEIVTSKQKRIQERQIIRNLPQIKIFLNQFISNQFFKQFIWIINVNLFIIVCYHRIDSYPQSIIILMLIFTLIISIQYIIKAYIFPLQIILKKPFLLYELTVSFVVTIFLNVLLIRSYFDQKYNYLYPYLVLFRIPSILKPVFFYLFKNKISSHTGLEQINPYYQQDMSVNIRFTSRFIEVFFILYIVMLVFSAIGQIIFAGKINNDITPLLIQNQMNTDYIFMNFNSTLSSFVTLFALLIVNNWNSIIAVYVLVFESRSVRLFFIMYFMLAVLVAYNLVIASILDYVVKLAELKQKRLQDQQNQKKNKKSKNSIKLKQKNFLKVKKALVNLLKKQLNKQTLSQSSFFNKNKKSIQQMYIQECIEQQIKQLQEDE